MLYEIAFTHGNMENEFNLFTVTPKQLVLKSSAVNDISSFVLVVEESGDCLDLSSFIQAAVNSCTYIVLCCIKQCMHFVSHFNKLQ